MSHLGIFSEFFASEANTDLSGQRKRQKLIDAYGEKGFDYAGNAKIDLKVWLHARKAILVNPEQCVRGKAERLFEINQVFDTRDTGLRPYIKAVRLNRQLCSLSEQEAPLTVYFSKFYADRARLDEAGINYSTVFSEEKLPCDNPETLVGSFWAVKFCAQQ